MGREPSGATAIAACPGSTRTPSATFQRKREAPRITLGVFLLPGHNEPRLPGYDACMVDEEKVQQLDKLLRSAARAHHAEFGGPNPGWPEWYAEYVQPHIGEMVGFEPTVEQVAEWLKRADELQRADAPDDHWPPFYARWIVESFGR